MPVTYLIDLDETDVHMGPWIFGKGSTAIPPQTISFKGIKSPNGLGMHPPVNGTASVKYKLDKAFRVFETASALNDTTPGSQTPLSFEVVGDGRVLWTSGQINMPRTKQDCKANVSGVSTLELRVTCPGGFAGAHAVWLEPRVVK